MEYVSQSEARVVAQQIKSRSRQDAAYLSEEMNATVLESGGSFGVVEDVLCVYADLDCLIKDSKLTQEQQSIVEMLMEGYSIRDIAELEGCDAAYVERQFRNAVERIVSSNNERWLAVYGRSFFDNPRK